MRRGKSEKFKGIQMSRKYSITYKTHASRIFYTLYFWSFALFWKMIIMDNSVCSHISS